MSARTLPGFRPALGFTIVYLSLLVLIPLTGVFLKSTGISWSQYLAHREQRARRRVVSPDARRGGPWPR